MAHIYTYIYTYIYIHTHTHIYIKYSITCIMECYSAIKKNEVMPFPETWMDLEIIILSEVSQTEKDKYHTI